MRCDGVLCFASPSSVSQAATGAINAGHQMVSWSNETKRPICVIYVCVPTCIVNLAGREREGERDSIVVSRLMRTINKRTGQTTSTDLVWSDILASQLFARVTSVVIVVAGSVSGNG